MYIGYGTSVLERQFNLQCIIGTFRATNYNTTIMFPMITSTLCSMQHYSKRLNIEFKQRRSDQCNRRSHQLFIFWMFPRQNEIAQNYANPRLQHLDKTPKNPTLNSKRPYHFDIEKKVFTRQKILSQRIPVQHVFAIVVIHCFP